MRRVFAVLAACLATLACTASAGLAAHRHLSISQVSLTHSLNQGMRAAGPYSGAYVVDLTTGQALYSNNAGAPRLPASVEKLYTTSTVLLKFQPTATLNTDVLGVGQTTDGTYTGTLFLRGGGDPTFGSAAFDNANYGTGATVETLAANLINSTGLQTLSGNVIADQSVFDGLRGTPATGYGPSTDVEGELGGLSFNRGWATIDGTVFFQHPAIEAGLQFLAALKADGVKIKGDKVHAGITPPFAQPLASVASPPMATLVAMTNTPSDNFFAETLLKDLGAQFGGGGTTANGAAVVRSTIATTFGLHPRLNDGSGLSRYDRTTPFDVVSLLRDQQSDQPFVQSLATAGETGTLVDEMRHTYAQGRCRGKTGTLHDVSNLVGYCQARDGHLLAFAFLMNGIYPGYAHPIQDKMVVAVAKYDG
jgi:D-alanyl-D-alanine carboxypeptidase/D-alanyl-D-alanine-endopeptidase (penicillin-binding protein 4)